MIGLRIIFLFGLLSWSMSVIPAQKKLEFDVFFGLALMTFENVDSVNHFTILVPVKNESSMLIPGDRVWLDFCDGTTEVLRSCCYSKAYLVGEKFKFKLAYHLTDLVLRKLTEVKLSEIRIEKNGVVGPPYTAWISAGEIRRKAREFKEMLD